MLPITMPMNSGVSERKKESVLNDLLARFVTGGYRFGEKISAKAVAEEMGVSRFPVMAALNDLRSAGLIVVTAQVGCQVISPNAAEIHDFFLFFGRMEGIMAELAAERRSPEEVRRMRSINQAIRAISATAGAGEAYRRLNQDLHREIHAAARSPMLHGRQLANWAMSDFLISQAGGFGKRFRQAAKEHAEIIDCINHKSAPRARMAMEQHIQRFAQTVGTLFEEGASRRREMAAAAGRRRAS